MENELSIRALGDKFLIKTRPGFLDILLIRLRHITLADTLGQSIGEHGARRRFEVIALARWVAGRKLRLPVCAFGSGVLWASGHDLPPQASLRVLVLHDRLQCLLQDGYEPGPLWVALGKPVERVGEAHAVPAHRPAPHLGA